MPRKRRENIIYRGFKIMLPKIHIKNDEDRFMMKRLKAGRKAISQRKAQNIKIQSVGGKLRMEEIRQIGRKIKTGRKPQSIGGRL